MCGIAGIINFNGSPPQREVIEKMSACIAHRGPDYAAVYLDDHAALAHRRLAIIDLDPRANQPFSDGHHTIVFNGEIYNFRELRAQLPAPWRTESDTEVLLRAYQTWGPPCLNRLNGMFAFAIWNSQTKELFLARDRMGQKPLYYRTKEGVLAFASELSALKNVPGFDGEVDECILHSYLQLGYVGKGKTIYRWINQLLPGFWARANAAGFHAEKYFDPEYDHSKGPPDVSEPVERTRELLSNAVRKQLVADVPVGCFLSGGIDSSVTALAMSRAIGKQQKLLTFSIGFDDPRYDETQYAREVARHLRTEHHEFIVRLDAAVDLPKLAAVYGEPFADSSALPTHYLARETRKFVKVALSGDGGDELFGGYDRYRAMRLSHAISPLEALASAATLIPAGHPKDRRTKLRRLLQGLNLSPADRYAQIMAIFDNSQIQELTGCPITRSVVARQFEEFNKSLDDMRAAMATDRATYLPGDLLVKLDRASMLHALEVRSPFMDHELVQFAASLSSKLLARKRLLRDAFARDLPAFVFKRRKMGFAVPIGDWLRTSLKPMLRDLLFASNSFARGNFSMSFVEKMIDEHDRGIDHSHRLYALLMLELWYRTTI